MGLEFLIQAGGVIFASESARYISNRSVNNKLYTRMPTCKTNLCCFDWQLLHNCFPCLFFFCVLVITSTVLTSECL